MYVLALVLAILTMGWHTLTFVVFCFTGSFLGVLTFSVLVSGESSSGNSVFRIAFLLADAFYCSGGMMSCGFATGVTKMVRVDFLVRACRSVIGGLSFGVILGSMFSLLWLTILTLAAKLLGGLSFFPL